MLKYIDMFIERENFKFHVYALRPDFVAEDLGAYSTMQEARSVCFEYGFISQ